MLIIIIIIYAIAAKPGGDGKAPEVPKPEAGETPPEPPKETQKPPTEGQNPTGGNATAAGVAPAEGDANGD